MSQSEAYKGAVLLVIGVIYIQPAATAGTVPELHVRFVLNIVKISYHCSRVRVAAGGKMCSSLS